MARIYVFWDNSNIFVGAKHVAVARDGLFSEKALRIKVEALHHLAVWGRNAVKTVVVGSQSRDVKLLDVIKRIDAHFEIYERGASSNKEQAVDAALQVHMLRALVDESEPCVAVLLTGDGAGYESGMGFRADLERMANKGWGVEVLSWTNSCDEGLRRWAERVGVFIPLEKHYDCITFIEGGRRPTSFPITGRPVAMPKPDASTTASPPPTPQTGS
jgi:hypothetical protein